MGPVGPQVPVAPGPPLVAAALLNGVMVSRRGDGEPSLWDATCLLTGTVVVVVHFQLITRGSGQLFDFELLGAAFDALATALLRGSTEVDSHAIRWEGMKIEGRTYMYFGPWPALLRIALAWLEPILSGPWSRLS